MRRYLILLLALAAAAAAAGADAAGDVTPQQALATLNAIRAENGLPHEVKLNLDWSSKCAAHDRYMRLNNIISHSENPSKPGYSDGGDWAAANSVLAQGGSWGADATPWDNAPIHLMQILAPQLAEVGAAVVNGFSCLTSWPGFGPQSAEDALDVFPGEGRTVPPSQHADELPFTPQRFAGIPDAQTTGPYLYAFADGPWAGSWSDRPRVTDASLVGPDGEVEIRHVDSATEKLGPLLPPGGILIPVQPLKPGALYKASVTVADSLDTLSRTWTFTTALWRNAGSVRVYTRPPSKVIYLLVQSEAPDTTVSIYTPDHRTQKVLRRPAKVVKLTLWAHASKQPYLFCLDSGGQGSGYEPLHYCTKKRVR